MGVKITTASFLENQLSRNDLEELVEAFRKFKADGDCTDFFGRDYPYMGPQKVKDEDLWHAHIPDPGSPRFKLRVTQFRRSSDTALVYCRAYFDDDHYLLIGILYTAHTAYQQTPRTWYLPFLEIAKEFRESH
ncbi:type II toxin-antitoxin system YafO family toxin [Massilia sp. W12]|uniref:type II toxin-antitoxin system YafO family toxin n=1 Tax=Massilia sp. W12 TaxID=3126507 RepID=UPI0030CDB7A1